jgi:hypothetical protein
MCRSLPERKTVGRISLTLIVNVEDELRSCRQPAARPTQIKFQHVLKRAADP